MNILTAVLDGALALCVIWDALQFSSQYHRMKQRIADGDPQARTRLYFRVIASEWLTALLALCALRFDWSRLTPKSLQLDESFVIRFFSFKSLNNGFWQGAMEGVIAAIALVTVIVILVRQTKAKQQQPTTVSSPSPWRRFVPDFSALIPVTGRERWLWTAAAISAGICEEVVYRGWLLETLHARLGMSGGTLILVAALIFGLAHVYQNVPGVIQTGLAGLFFCVVYVVSGSLWLPIVIHAAIDLRVGLFPAGGAPALGSAQQSQHS